MATSKTSLDNQQQQKVYIPYTMSTWPWRRMVNPHEKEVEAESKAWLRTFSSRMENAPNWEGNIERSRSARLASIASPCITTKEQLRIGSDLIYLYLIIDDCLDIESAPVVQELVDMINNVLKSPHTPRPEGENLLGQLVKEFCELTLRTATPLAAKHFLESFPTYLEANVIHARDRDNDHVPTVEEYFGSRRDNVGSKAIFLLGEVALNIPDEAYCHSVIEELQNCSLDMIIIDNDMVSYKKEHAVDDVRWNLIAIVMRQFGLGINEAMIWACDYHHKVQRQFISLLNNVPLFGPEIDKEISAYIFHLANFAQGNHCWNFETGRYLGDTGLEVQRNGWVYI